MSKLNRFGVNSMVDASREPGKPDTKIVIDEEADTLRVDRYNPWHILYWLVSGRRAGIDLRRYESANQMPRELALELCTTGIRFPHQGNNKGRIRAGQPAELIVLSSDYFAIPEEDIKSLESRMTVVAGEIVYAEGPYAEHGPAAVPVSPDLSSTQHQQ